MANREVGFLGELASNYASKASSFATLYFSTLFGVYALLAVSLQVLTLPTQVLPDAFLVWQGVLATQWVAWYFLFYTLLAFFLLLGSLFSALHYFWYTSLSAKAIQWIQAWLWTKKFWPLPPEGPEDKSPPITKRLIEGPSRNRPRKMDKLGPGALWGKGWFKRLHDGKWGPRILRLAFVIGYIATCCLVILVWLWLGGAALVNWLAN